MTAGAHKLLVRVAGNAPPPETGAPVSVHCDGEQAWVAAGDPPDSAGAGKGGGDG